MGVPQGCQAEACAIQTCLDKNNYQENKCQSYVLALYKCCSEMYKSQEGGGKVQVEGSTACPIESVVNRKMKQFEKEGALSTCT